MDAKTMDTKTMDTKTIVEEMNAVSGKYGPWHYCNIYLQDGVYTMSPKIIGDEIKFASRYAVHF